MERFLAKENILTLSGVFAVLFVASQLGRFIFFGVNTSPALIWPPVGIALAAAVLYGYRIWPAVALAAFLTALTAHAPFASIVASTLANTVQVLVGAYVLQKMGFKPDMLRVRDTIAILVVAFFATMVGPSIGVPIQLLAHTLTAPAAVVWGRTWGGWLLSVLILTPLIVIWFSGERIRITRQALPELAFIFSFLLGTSFFLFWTYWQPVTIWVALLFFIPLLWMALRASPRSMTMGLFLSTVIAVSGTIIAHPDSAVSVSQQLLSDEVFIALIASIFLVITSVVTEKRTANAEAQRYVEQLQEALQTISVEDKTKNEFIAILAHELRNPLSPVVSTLELLKLKEHDAETVHMIEGIEGHIHTMGRLLDDLLDISRVSHKSFALKKEPVLLSTLIQHTFESTRLYIDSRGHELKVTVPKNPISLVVDPVRVEQILVNLLHNAAKYTSPGGRIELTAVQEDSELVIIVRDNGCGISAENLPTIFEPFRRIAISRRSGGLGIGLSITKQLVEMHGGSIAVTSDGPEQGSTFIVRLPLPSIEIRSAAPKAPRKIPKASPFKYWWWTTTTLPRKESQNFLSIRAIKWRSLITEKMHWRRRSLLNPR